MNKKSQYLYKAAWKEWFKKTKESSDILPSLGLSQRIINKKFKLSEERTKSRLAQRKGYKKPKLKNPRIKILSDN